MKARARTRFDVDTLRALAGDKVFARGKAYYLNRQVELLAMEPERVLARVAGSEDYRTALTARGAEIDGECSCPAFDDRGFCKHMVAAALAANAAGDEGEAEGTGTLARIRDHLRRRGVDALVEMIVELAEEDPALFRRLDMAAATFDADDKTIEARLRKAINGATATTGYVDYYRASGWAAGVDSALEAIAELVAGGRPGMALTLVELAIARIERAIEAIDDSDGHCGELLRRARDIHLEACRAARPDPAELARDLFARETEDPYGTFHGAAALYADVLGEAGLAEYRRLAADAWETLAPLVGPGEFSRDYMRLASILDFFAERDGDVAARIAIRAKNLSSPWNYLRLAEFCLAQGRDEEALRYAEEGLWVFEDERPHERLVFFTADLLRKAGRKQDAEAHLWRAFEKAPGLELYDALRKLGGKQARERVLAYLEARASKDRRTPWHSPADLLVLVLTKEKMFDAAWRAVRRHEASLGAKECLARASETAHPREALEVYAERVEQLVQTGGNDGYAQAVRLIARMAALRGAAEQAAYLADLKVRFRRKRNFMKLLG